MTATMQDADVRALAVAQQLVAAGVPLFLAAPAQDDSGAWVPDGGSGGCGYHLPRGWQQARPDPTVVDRWKPGMALCAVMGHVVDGLDVDPRNGGDASRAALEEDGAPRSYGRAVTPSGGTHELIKPLRVGSKDGLMPGIDLKGGSRHDTDGGGHGFLFIAPTVKLSKSTGVPDVYRWEVEPHLSDIVKDDHSGQALAKRVLDARPVRRSVGGDLDVQPATADQQAYARAEVARAAERVRQLPEGQRHAGLYTAAHLVGGYVAAAQLDEDDAAALLVAAGIDVGLGEDAARTAADGVRTGMANPVKLPEQAVAAQAVNDGHRHHHERFAGRLEAAYADRIMWVTGLGWFGWDGKRWVEDTDAAEPMRCVAEVCQQAVEAAVSGDGPRDVANEAKRSMTANGYRGILQVAASKRGLRAHPADLDADPWLLNTQNGTVDLRTGDLLPHSPADRITKVTRAAWVPGEQSAVWEGFLQSSLPDAGVRSFLQRYMGLALVGEVIEHKLLVNAGAHGRNGKGVLAHAFTRALGEYAGTADPEVFLMDPRHPMKTASTEAKILGLRGQRAVFMSEIQRGTRLNESVMKALTGGDVLVGKRLHGQPVEFAPSHTFVVAANDLPTVDADAAAVWARLLIVPWEQSFVGREDTGLYAAVALAADAVLAWAWEGLQAWELLGRKLAPPAAVTARTDDYRSSNDVVAEFLEDVCVLGDEQWAAHTGLKVAYRGWVARTGRRTGPTATELVARLRERGLQDAKRQGTRGLRGVGIQGDAPFGVVG